MSDPQLRKATPAEMGRVGAEGDMIVGFLEQMPPRIRMDVLVYVVAAACMGVRPKPPTTTLDVFDLYMRAARVTLENHLNDKPEGEDGGG